MSSMMWEGLYLHSTVPLLKVDKGIVFKFLDPLQLPKLAEGLLQDLLCDTVGQVSHKQHLHLPDGHRRTL